MATFSRHVDVDWNGSVMDGKGQVKAGTGAFTLPVTFPARIGEPAGHTSPEELIAAAHAACYAMALNGTVGRKGGSIAKTQGHRDSHGRQGRGRHQDRVVEAQGGGRRPAGRRQGAVRRGCARSGRPMSRVERAARVAADRRRDRGALRNGRGGCRGTRRQGRRPSRKRASGGKAPRALSKDDRC